MNRPTSAPGYAPLWGKTMRTWILVLVMAGCAKAPKPGAGPQTDPSVHPPGTAPWSLPPEAEAQVEDGRLQVTLEVSHPHGSPFPTVVLLQALGGEAAADEVRLEGEGPVVLSAPATAGTWRVVTRCGRPEVCGDFLPPVGPTLHLDPEPSLNCVSDCFGLDWVGEVRGLQPDATDEAVAAPVRLRWDPVPGAAWYRLSLGGPSDDHPGFTTYRPLADVAGSANAYRLSALLPDDGFDRWTVAALDAQGRTMARSRDAQLVPRPPRAPSETPAALRATGPGDPYLGVMMGPAGRVGWPGGPQATDLPGVVVTGVGIHSPALAAGLRPDDVLTAIHGEPVTSVEQALTAIRRHAPGAEIVLACVRDGERLDVTVVLGEVPARFAEGDPPP